jgi:Carboxypeptidase regulatory-like domain
MKTDNSLDRIRIASPCPITWERMTGDDRVRFCDECSLHVYNIAELTRAEADTLIAKSEGRLCARIYRRADGTVITRDCPVGLRAIRRRVARSAAAVFAAFMALAGSVFGQQPGSKDKSSCRQQVVMKRETTKAPSGLSELNGTILDPNGAVVLGAEIKVQAAGDGKPITTKTNAEGNFSLAGLQPGLYNLQITLSGFKQLQLSNVSLKGNEKLNLETTLLLDSSSVVVGLLMFQPTLIDTPPGTFIINQKMIQSLPIH